MPIVINGSGTITGVSTGGLPDGIVDADMLATDAVTSAKILNATIVGGDIASGTVTSSNITDATIASGDLASGAITSGAMPTGSLLQVDSNTVITTLVTSSTSMVDTGFGLSMTPSATSSKILFILSGGRTDSATYHQPEYQLQRKIGSGSYSVLRSRLSHRNYRGSESGGAGDGYMYYGDAHSYQYLDSPNTTSEVYYRIYFRTDRSTHYFNTGSCDITVTLMEIKG